MERTVISWSVPNMITIWLMMIALIAVYAVGCQVFRQFGGNSSSMSNQAVGY